MTEWVDARTGVDRVGVSITSCTTPLRGFNVSSDVWQGLHLTCGLALTDSSAKRGRRSRGRRVAHDVPRRCRASITRDAERRSASVSSSALDSVRSRSFLPSERLGSLHNSRGRGALFPVQSTRPDRRNFAAHRPWSPGKVFAYSTTRRSRFSSGGRAERDRRRGTWEQEHVKV